MQYSKQLQDNATIFDSHLFPSFDLHFVLQYKKIGLSLSYGHSSNCCCLELEKPE